MGLRSTELHFFKREILVASFTFLATFLFPQAAVRCEDGVKFREAAEIEKLPASVKTWLTWETERLSREVDDQRLVSPTQNDQADAFKPESRRVFELRGYWIPEEKLHIFHGTNSTPLMRAFERVNKGRRESLLLVHPESFDLYRELIKGSSGHEVFLAAATASSRSLLVWKEGMEKFPFIAKVSLNKEIGGVNRSISAKETSMSVGTNRILDRAESEFPRDIRFMREIMSSIPKDMERGGMILRELPKEMLEQGRLYAPLFALYGRSSSAQTPLLADMINKSGMSASDFVRERIVRPLARQWVEMALYHGLLTEPHAQNVLMEIGRNQMPTGTFMYRDFGGFNIDFEQRRRLGLHMPKDLPSLASTIVDNYYQDAHFRNFRTSLNNFLEAGFLYNLEKKSTDWSRAGLIRSAGLSEGASHEILLDEIERELKIQTGQEVHLARDYSDISSVMSRLSQTSKLSKKWKRRCLMLFDSMFRSH